MYVITVTFEIAEEHLEEFRGFILKQAENSLTQEVGCKQFDVCFGSEQANLCFLYEKYDDRAAFDKHLKQPYFAVFDEAVKSFVVRKEVATWNESTS